MKTLTVLLAVLATAGAAHGFALGLEGDADGADNGDGTRTWALDITIDLERAPDVIEMVGLGFGSSTDPGVLSVDWYWNNVSEWNAWYIAPPPGYMIGLPDSSNGEAGDSDWVQDGYDLGGIGSNITQSGSVLGTITVSAPAAALPITLDVFAQYTTHSGFTIWPPTTPDSIVLTPEPCTALLMLLAVMPGLARRR
jgi:hypothetical protein